MPTTVTLDTTLGAKPVVQLGRHHGGSVRAAVNTVEVAAASLNEADDRVMVLALPADARLIDLVIFNDDLDSNGSPTLTMDVGIFYGDKVIGQSAGTAIDDDALATAITTLQSANTSGVRILHEANDIANAGKPLFELAGLTANPGGNLNIGLSVANAAATAAAGTVTMMALFV